MPFISRHAACECSPAMTQQNYTPPEMQDVDTPDAQAMSEPDVEPYGPQGQAIYDALVAAAGAREFVFYTALGEDLGLDLADERDRLKLWDVLSEISRSEVSVGRPMLSAICVQEKDHLPGPGFLALGRELGVAHADEDEVDFAVRQIKAVHDHWSDLAPFGERETPDVL